MKEVADLDACEAVLALESRAVSAVDLVDSCLNRIESEQGKAINAFIHIDADDARKAAQESDQRRSSGQLISPLDGIPIAVKDNIDVQGQPTSNGFAHAWLPDRDAPVVARLRDAGMIVLGKLNMHEGALGATTDNHHHGRCEHPFYPGFTPGGSSGGSAAAVAGGLCPITLGTDTMGSVRLPAAYCGITGMKPSRGFWSTNGVKPLAHGLDTVGPLAKTVQDIALLLNFDRAGHDLDEMRIGVLTYENVGVEADCKRSFSNAFRHLSNVGAQIEMVAFSNFDAGATRRAGFKICQADAARSFAELASTKPQAFSDEFRSMLDYGRNVTPEAYQAARNTIEIAGQAFLELMDTYDVMIGLTAPHCTFPFGDEVPTNQADFTAVANFAGCPVISLPIPTGAGCRPVGLQLMSAVGSDELLVQSASQVEQILSTMEN